MKIFILVIATCCNIACAEQVYGIEEALNSSIKIPESVLSDLKNEVDLANSGCTQRTLADALEATNVKLGSKYATFLVKPNLHAWCLCGAYLCPAWIYQQTGVGTKRIWSTAGTALITIQDKNFHGYRKISIEGGTAGHGFEEQWVWDGRHYKLGRKKSWVTGQ